MKNLKKIFFITILIILTYPLNYSHGNNEAGLNSFEKYISNPSEYDNKKIVIEGEINNYKFTTSDSGKPYTLFKIKDPANNTLQVYFQGEHLKIKKGSVVKVSGKFLKQKRYAFYNFKNVVKAQNVIIKT
jgi:exonuclease VII large subunit